MKKRQKEVLAAWLFLLPSLLGFLLVRLIPTGFTFVLSTYDWDMIGEPIFVGFQMFSKIFQDPVFFQVMWNTLYYTIGCLVLRVALGLLLANVFHSGLRWAAAYKAIYFIPVIVPWAAAAVVWNYLFAQDVGPINIFLNALSVPSVPWLTSSKVAMTSMILVSTWKQLGYTTLLLLGGLSSIDSSYYEVAYLSGATAWQKFRYITFPLLSPTILFVMITEIIFSFQIFDPIYIMTKGGPAASTQTIGYYIYSNAFKRYELGYAAGLSVILFIVIMLFTLIQWKGQKKWVHYE